MTTYPLPTAAILCAEASTERWCCPLCGGLNNAALARGSEHSAKGYCQHDKCVSGRRLMREHGLPVFPEILFPAYAFDGRPTVRA